MISGFLFSHNMTIDFAMQMQRARQKNHHKNVPVFLFSLNIITIEILSQGSVDITVM